MQSFDHVDISTLIDRLSKLTLWLFFYPFVIFPFIQKNSLKTLIVRVLYSQFLTSNYNFVIYSYLALVSPGGLLQEPGVAFLASQSRPRMGSPWQRALLEGSRVIGREPGLLTVDLAVAVVRVTAVEAGAATQVRTPQRKSEKVQSRFDVNLKRIVNKI